MGECLLFVTDCHLLSVCIKVCTCLRCSAFGTTRFMWVQGVPAGIRYRHRSREVEIWGLQAALIIDVSVISSQPQHEQLPLLWNELFMFYSLVVVFKCPEVPQVLQACVHKTAKCPVYRPALIKMYLAGTLGHCCNQQCTFHQAHCKLQLADSLPSIRGTTCCCINKLPLRVSLPCHRL